MRCFAVLAVLTLAACGANGPPQPPVTTASPPALSMTGSATAGIASDGG